MTDDGSVEILSSSSVESVLEDFTKSILKLKDGSESSHDPKQVLLAGFNNFAFDDHLLLYHSKEKLSADLMTLMRRKVFTADIKSAIKSKCSLSELLRDSNMNEYEESDLHDALNDCCALMTVALAHKLSLDSLLGGARSLESVYARRTNPLLRAKLITDAVAAKMPETMTCQRYLSMTDDELTNHFQNIGLGGNSIVTCLKKKAKIFNSEMISLLLL